MSIDVHLRHAFGQFKLDVSFRIDRPGITALFGPSGSGKTTTINALAGLFKPRTGRIVIGDRVVLDTERRIFVPARDRRIGYVFQDARLFPHMNVNDNLRFGWRRARRADEAQFADVVGMLGLEPLLSRKPAYLSGGERSRTAIGRALLADPSLLLLDEPLAALDAPRREEVIPYLEKLRDHARIPIFYVTHSVEEFSRLADQAVLLKNGRVATTGRVFDLLSDLEFTALAGVSAFGSVIPARVSGQREPDALTTLTFDGGELVVPRIERPVGSVLRIRIRAEDVLLARELPSGISANNVIPAVIAEIHAPDASHADVQLACGGTRLVARITRYSQARLQLAPGMSIFAIIKSVTVDPQIGSSGAPTK